MLLPRGVLSLLLLSCAPSDDKEGAGDTGATSAESGTAETGLDGVETGDTGATGETAETAETADTAPDTGFEHSVADDAPPDFELVDLNPGSARYGEWVSPRDYLEQVSGWYFTHAT